VRKMVPESSNDGKTSDAGFGAQTMWMHNPFFNYDGNARERGLVCVCVCGFVETCVCFRVMYSLAFIASPLGYMRV
jgi:hypothetical protein